MFKNLKSTIRYNWTFLKVLNSPFRSLKLRWYFGEIKMGTPYFLPRKWVKMTKADCKEALARDLANSEKHGWKFNRDKKWEDYKNFTKAVPLKYFGINWNTLGWKTKWNEFRFEHNPSFSMVLFGKQLHITITPNTDHRYWDSYWEGWLYYNYRTNSKASKLERFEQLQKIFQCTWLSNTGSTDHYNFILNPKYQQIYERKSS